MAYSMNHVRFGFQKCSESDFISFWERFYQDLDKKYENHIKHDGSLEAIDIRHLLEWKNQSKLSRPKMKVARKAENELNRFRELRSLPEITPKDESDFWETVSWMVKSGTAWKAFLFHIARPSEYPILDQHVVRAYYYLTAGERKEIPKNATKEEYLELVTSYRTFFRNLKVVSGKSDRQIDRALLCFGQFLKRYPQAFSGPRGFH